MFKRKIGSNFPRENSKARNEKHNPHDDGNKAKARGHGVDGVKSRFESGGVAEKGGNNCPG
jgi:hypothetical protein